MATIPLRKAVVACLKATTETRLTAREIANWIFTNYPNEAAEKLRKSTSLRNEADLLQQIVAEIGANRPKFQIQHPELKTNEDRPRKYWWSANEHSVLTSSETSILPEKTESDDSVPTENTLSESQLYPILVQFLWAELGLYSKRIDEKRSSNKSGPKGNHWLFPDLVSMEDLSKDWTQGVRDCVAQIGAQKVRLWSFEVKIAISRANVRECYFQTVSNSSWANLAYLVASQIEGSRTMAELRMLAALHGVGVILLDPANPSESQIVIPAIERENVDWSTASRLSAENPDFDEVVTLVRQFHQTGDPRPKDWDSSGLP
jgi:uncharacterized protein